MGMFAVFWMNYKIGKFKYSFYVVLIWSIKTTIHISSIVTGEFEFIKVIYIHKNLYIIWKRSFATSNIFPSFLYPTNEKMQFNEFWLIVHLSHLMLNINPASSCTFGTNERYTWSWNWYLFILHILVAMLTYLISSYENIIGRIWKYILFEILKISNSYLCYKFIWYIIRVNKIKIINTEKSSRFQSTYECSPFSVILYFLFKLVCQLNICFKIFFWLIILYCL